MRHTNSNVCHPEGARVRLPPHRRFWLAILACAGAAAFNTLAQANVSEPAGLRDCAALRTLQLKDTEITFAEVVSAGTLAPEGARDYQGRPLVLQELPPFCRVAGISRPTPDSEIRFEVWLPGEWAARYEQIGNGGWAGSIPYPGLAQAIRAGFFAAATDDGHRGAFDDAGWAVGHPEKLVDFGYRAVHVTDVAAQAIGAAFYHRGPRFAYFNGCSDGGREALMTAQRFPNDFDGWVVGAPANDWAPLSVAFIRDYDLLVAAGLKPNQLELLTHAALERCDAKDGIQDGLIADPRACGFDPHTLVCKANATEGCLTLAQADAIEQVYKGLGGKAPGSQVFPGRYGTIGTEAEREQWPLWLTGPRPIGFSIASAYLREVVYSDPKIDLTHLDPVRALKDSRERTDATLSALDPDLSKIRAAHKKILQYHGWADAAIPADYSIAYYESVRKRLGGDVRDFYRLFLAPGMAHCGAGPGPNAFGGATPGSVFDPKHDIVAALADWVESGHAPEQIIATKFEHDDPHGKVLRTRPLCVYPAVARWSGKGSSDEAANFSCVAPRGEINR